MSFVGPIFSNDSPDSSVFGIPLDMLNRTRFENRGQSVDNTDVASTLVDGLNEFVGDSNNQLLRCLMKLDQFFPLSALDMDETAEDDSVSRTLSPLVLYGESGTGKTSLALSMLFRLCENENGSDLPDRPVCLAASEFYRRYVAAMDRQSIGEFRQRVYSSPGLLIDNVGQLEDKFAAQRELVFLIDQLERLGKPVIITMQSSPSASNILIPQLMSRLCGGMSLPVLPPGIEARRKIIDRLALIHQTPLESEAAEWVARRMTVSVPKLNHFFFQLKTELVSRRDVPTGKPVDMATLGILFQQDQSTIDAMTTRIIETVADQFEMSSSALCSNSRKQTVVMARGVAIWLLRTMLGLSYHSIGTCFGNRDHTTILHAYQKYDTLITDDSNESDTGSSLAKMVEKLQQRLNDIFAGQMTLIP